MNCFKSAPKTGYITISVSNLEESVTSEDLKSFVRRYAGDDSDPIVKPFVRDGGKKATTVIFKGKSAKWCRNAAKQMRSQLLVDEDGLTSTVSISVSFEGLTVLSESTGPSAFDIIFVHGLNGHGCKTWTTKPRSHAESCLWPRDVLPQYLSGKHLPGRYITFGYQAEMLSWEGMEFSIHATAMELLQAISGSEKTALNRPMFFVCHSLGGLIVCQAVVLALANDADPELRQHFFHSRTGKCLINGIVSFGTPFGGSRLANLIAPIIGIWQRDSSFVASLTIKNQAVASNVERFKDIRSHPEHQIPLLIFYEKRKMRKFFLQTFVTTRKSALGSFTDNVRSRSLLQDHRHMVKYSSMADRDFHQKVGPEISGLVKRGLQNMALSATAVAKFKDQDSDDEDGAKKIIGPMVRVMVLAVDGKGGFQELWLPQANFEMIVAEQSNSSSAVTAVDTQSSLLSQFAISPEAEKILKILMSGIESKSAFQLLAKQLKSVRPAVQGTCDWVSDDDLYKRWETSTSDSILFIEGQQGVGKSVLARFIIERLNKTYQSAAVIHFFTRSLGINQSSPVTILRYLILQLEEKQRGLLIKSLYRKRITSFGKQNEFDVLWSLFIAMKDEIDTDIFCIIDGLDEVRLESIESQSGGLDSMTRFLIQLCDLLNVVPKDTDVPEQTSRSKSFKTSALFTARPLGQVERAARNRNIVIKINKADVQERAAKMIEVDIKELGLPPDVEKDIRTNLLSKSAQTDSPFQWGHAVLERLRMDNFETDMPMNDRLDVYRPGIYSIYLMVLESISRNQATKELAGRLLRTLAFAQVVLKLDELEHAFTIFIRDKDHPLGVVSPATLRSVIKACRGLVVIDDKHVRLGHQSVKEFLVQLPEDKWPDFSCKNEEEGHVWMLRLCVRYLLAWVSQDMILLENNDKLDALLQRSKFLNYAIHWWVVHAKKSGTLVEKLLSLIGDLLQLDGLAYRVMLIVHEYMNGAEFSDENPWTATPPAFLLAAHGLVHILKNVPLKTTEKSVRSRSFQRIFRKKLEPRIFNFELDVNETSEDGSTLLHIAAECGSLEVVRYLIARGAKGKVFNKNGHTPFSLAARENNYKVAQELISSGQATERKYNKHFGTSLHWACCYKMEAVVEYFLDIDGMNVNTRVFDDWTPLLVASQAGNPQIVKALIEHGANVEAVKSGQITPLYIAAEKGHLDVIRILFEAKPDLDSAPRTDLGRTPLSAAARNGHLDTFRYLLEKNANVEPENDGHSPLHIASKYGFTSIVDLVATKANMEAATFRGRLPIHLAACNGHLETVRLLVERGADPDAKALDLDPYPEVAKTYSITPVFLATLNNHQDVVEFLIQQEVEIKAMQTGRGFTLLHEAARVGNQHLVQIYTEQYGLSPLAKTDLNWTPFHLAAANGHTGIVKFFRNSKSVEAFNIDIPAFENATALSCAVQENKALTVDYLLNQGANPHLLESNGRSTVWFASQFTDTAILSRLLREGVDVRSKNCNGGTALHAAAYHGIETSMKLLLDNGAVVNATNDMGETPLHEAAAARQLGSFKLLIRYGAEPLYLDGSGLSCLDLVSQYPPILELPELKKARENYAPLTPDARQAHIRRNIVKKLSHNIKFTTGFSRTWEEMTWFAILGNLLKHAKRMDDARICWEQALERNFDGEARPQYICDSCKKSGLTGAWWMCADCPALGTCSQCYLERADGKIARGCMAEHKYIEIGGGRWKKLEPGTVSEDETISQWISRLRKEFGVPEPISRDNLMPAGESSKPKDAATPQTGEELKS